MKQTPQHQKQKAHTNSIERKMQQFKIVNKNLVISRETAVDE